MPNNLSKLPKQPLPDGCEEPHNQIWTAGLIFLHVLLQEAPPKRKKSRAIANQAKRWCTCHRGEIKGWSGSIECEDPECTFVWYHWECLSALERSLAQKYAKWACLDCLFERARQFYTAAPAFWLNGITDLGHEEVIQRQRKVNNIINVVDMWRDQQSGSEYESDCDFRPETVSGSPRKILAGAPRVTVPNGRWSQAYISGKESPPVAAHPRDGPEPPYDDDSIVFSSDSEEGFNDAVAGPEDYDQGGLKEDATDEDVVDESVAVEQEADTSNYDGHRAESCDCEDGISEAAAGEEEADSSIHDEHHDTTPTREGVNGGLHDDNLDDEYSHEIVGDMVGRDEDVDAGKAAADNTSSLEPISPPTCSLQAIHVPDINPISPQLLGNPISTPQVSQQSSARAAGKESLCGQGSFNEPYTFLDESPPPPDDLPRSERRSTAHATEEIEDDTGAHPSASTPPTTASATSARYSAKSLARTSIRDLAAMATTRRAPADIPTPDKSSLVKDEQDLLDSARLWTNHSARVSKDGSINPPRYTLEYTHGRLILWPPSSDATINITCEGHSMPISVELLAKFSSVIEAHKSIAKAKGLDFYTMLDGSTLTINHVTAAVATNCIDYLKGEHLSIKLPDSPVSEADKKTLLEYAHFAHVLTIKPLIMAAMHALVTTIQQYPESFIDHISTANLVGQTTFEGNPAGRLLTKGANDKGGLYLDRAGVARICAFDNVAIARLWEEQKVEFVIPKRAARQAHQMEH